MHHTLCLATLVAIIALPACLASAVTTTTTPATTTATSATQPAKKPQVAVIKLSGRLLERPADFSLSMFTGGGTKSPALSDLITTLNKAAGDPNLSAVLIDLNSTEMSLSQAQELGGLIKKIRSADKKVFVFAADFDTPTYILASYANQVIMPSQGNVMVPGVQMGMMFFRGLLDTIHIQADMVQVGKFKGAEEPFTRKEASPEYKQQIDGLADSLYAQIISTIVANRKSLDETKVKAAVDEGWMSGRHARELGLVDQLLSRQQADTFVQKHAAATEVELVPDYGQKKHKTLDMDNPFAIFALLGDSDAKTRSNQPAIAVIYADGTIMPDSPNGLDDGANVTPARIRKAVKKALEDKLVKSIVLRIDSPGGSASASDDIWQIIKEADKTKPVTVSMGRVAASGGYYIACAGRSISADPATITGSIGVVGGKLVIKGLLDWAGINVQPVLRGQHAGMLTAQAPFTEEERTFIRKLMSETYDLFTARVKAGRGDKIPDIEAVAQGRLFTGPAAKEAGLVDEIRTLPETVQAAAKKAGIEKAYQILVYPEQRTLADIIREGFSADAKIPLELAATLKTMPPAYQREALKMLSMIRVLQEQRIMLASPLGLIEQ